MKHFWKKTVWAALLTMAFAVTASGCSGTDSRSSTADSTASQAAEDSVAADSGDTAQSQDDGYTYELLEDGTAAVTGYTGTDTVLSVPVTVDGYVVSKIGDHAFEANYDITAVTLPNGLSEIGEGAFMDCGSLASVEISNTVAQIDRAAFASCTSLTSIKLPATVSTVMEEAFTGCTGLEMLTVANSSLEYASWGLIEGEEPLQVTISCPPVSAIATWAEENGIPTEELTVY